MVYVEFSTAESEVTSKLISLEILMSSTILALESLLSNLSNLVAMATSMR
jgi:hypothetical protein